MIEKILLADDSALMRKSLCDIISAQDENRSIDTVMDGEEAFRAIRMGSYDICVINMYLKKMNGMEIIRALQSANIVVPIVMLGSSLLEDRDAASLIMERPYVRYVVRPFRLMGQDRDSFSKDMTSALSSLEKTWMKSHKKSPVSAQAPFLSPDSGGSGNVNRPVNQQEKPFISEGASNTVAGKNGRIVLIASSTGGPQALHRMIPMLPAHIGVPIVIVQHMPKGFTLSLAERIDQKALIHVKEAEDNEVLKPDVVYIAPGGRHLEVVEKGGVARCRVYDDPPVNNLRPCADVMIESFTRLSYNDIICVVLTGMGRDGTDGILNLKKRKKIHVITQSADTCVVYGMPKACDQAGLSNESVPIDMIAGAIAKELGV